MVEEVAEGIYRIPSVLGIRRFAQYLVVGDEVLLIDTGIDGTVSEHVMPALTQLGIAPDRVTQVAISHADADHYGGNAEVRALLPGSQIRAHASDRRLLEEWSVIGEERYGWYRHHGIGYEPAVMEWLHTSAGPDTPIDGDLTPGELIDLGGITVEVIALPGHTPGHVGFHHAQSGTTIVIDAVLERGLYSTDNRLISPPPYVSTKDYRATVETLRSLTPERLGTSHYAETEGIAAVTDFLDATAAFVDDLDTSILEMLSATPLPLSEYWEHANATVGPFPEMSIELARSVGAHLEDAEQRGVALRTERDGLAVWSAAP